MQPTSSFVHLHVHTQYSLLDGALQAASLCGRVKDLGMPAVAVTDHGNLFGALEFYLAAKEAGVKPIIGCEVYLAPTSRHDRTQRSQRDAVVTHLVLLAQNMQGYQNLCHIVTAGFFEGFYYKPRVDLEVLRARAQGLIALSGCVRGDLASLLRRGRHDLARERAHVLQDIFSGRFYVEIQRNGCKEMQIVEPMLLQLAKDLHLPVVATNDCHYLNREDQDAHEVLLCLQAGKTLEDEDRLRLESDELYLKSPQEMRSAFADLPEACDRTLEIADSCQIEFDLKTYHFPKFETRGRESLEEAFAQGARSGFEARLPTILKRVPAAEQDACQSLYRQRLEHEIETIQKMGFSGYFLIVADFVNFARKKGIPVGPGRGSAAGSLVAYGMGITDLDPIPHGLLFERFLNPERVSMPDIDMDFCIRGRDQVIRYVQERYGSRQSVADQGQAEVAHVAQIITFGKMQARAVIRDVGRVLNMPYAEVDRISKMVPPVLNITLAEALKQEKDLHALVSQEAQVARLMELAQKLEGLVRHASIHAAGVVITDEPLVEYMPLYKGADGEIVTQYDMKCVEKMGLIKFDFLGLRTLTLIQDAVQMIRATEKGDFDLQEVPLDDAKVYTLLSSGDTLGVFQLESTGMRDLLTKLRPANFEELIALVALYRPGPLGSGMVDDFIQRKHGRQQFQYPFAQLQPILQETYGIIVYQEQVMQIASVLANYTLGEADLLRRAMGKKKPEEMAKQKDRFLTGAAANGIARKDAEPMFELMEKFAEYGFNKSHSAAYALISYQTAYLKAHFPYAFMASLLNSEKENTDKIYVYLHDCRARGIEILPPDVNESEQDFTVVAGPQGTAPSRQIRFGLAAVKNVGAGAVEAILEERRKEGPFRDLQDFCTRVDLRRVNRRVVESLIMCGAFDFSSPSRSYLHQSLDRSLELGQRQREIRLSGQRDIFATMGENPPSVMKEHAPSRKILAEEWAPLHRLMLEKKALGFFITGHPLRFYEVILGKFANANTQTLAQMKSDQEVRLGGVVTAVKKKMSRRGQHFAFIQFEDIYGVVEGTVFSDLFEQKGAYLSREEPLFLVGHVDVGEEKAKIVVKDLFTMEEAEFRLASRLEIRLPSSAVREVDLQHLKEAIAPFKGPCPIYVRVQSMADSRACELLLSLPREFSIAPSAQVVKAVNQVFQSEVVRWL